MLQRGSQMIRLPDDRQERVQLLTRLAKKEKVVLQIQEELVHKGFALSKTEADSSAKNFRALEDLREEFTKQLASRASLIWPPGASNQS